MEYTKVVIKIPEEMYKWVNEVNKFSNDYGMGDFIDLIKNGTPLSKGHGELKDADAMINKLCTDEASEFFGSVTCAEIMDFINNEKPIIEADTETDDYYRGAQEEY